MLLICPHVKLFPSRTWPQPLLILTPCPSALLQPFDHLGIHVQGIMVLGYKVGLGEVSGPRLWDRIWEKHLLSRDWLWVGNPIFRARLAQLRLPTVEAPPPISACWNQTQHLQSMLYCLLFCLPPLPGIINHSFEPSLLSLSLGPYLRAQCVNIISNFPCGIVSPSFLHIYSPDCICLCIYHGPSESCWIWHTQVQIHASDMVGT